MKRYETACRVGNFGLALNRVVVPHKKLGGQHLRLLTREMLQNWVENLYDNFASEDTVQYFQGDGDAPPKIRADGTEGGVTHLLMVLFEQQNSCISSICIMLAQKQAGLHLTTQRTLLLNNKNCVTSGKLPFLVCHLFVMLKFLTLHNYCSFLCHRCST
jgi:hypothetical protein